MADPAKTKWEYKVHTHKVSGKKLIKHEETDVITEFLNERGAEGWELVNVVQLSATAGLDFAGSTQGLALFFRRQVK